MQACTGGDPATVEALLRCDPASEVLNAADQLHKQTALQVGGGAVGRWGGGVVRPGAAAQGRGKGGLLACCCTARKVRGHVLSSQHGVSSAAQHPPRWHPWPSPPTVAISGGHTGCV